ncbi:hypothetical protein, partial [Streptomyces neyagawaensis]
MAVRVRRPRDPTILPFDFNTNEAQKVEDDAKFKTTAAGKVQFTITKKTYDHGIGIRLRKPDPALAGVTPAAGGRVRHPHPAP